jgi:hypothetical protein
MYNGSLVTQVFNTLSDKSTVNITFPDKLLTLNVGKNGNAIAAANKKGMIAMMELRPLMANADDSFLQSQIVQWTQNPTAYTAMVGTFVKNFGDGQGNITRKSYVLNFGFVEENIPLTENVEGETDQAIALYKLVWGFAVPVID